MFDENSPGRIHIYSGTPPEVPMTSRERVNHLLDLIQQLTALDIKREALRAELLKLCYPSS